MALLPFAVLSGCQSEDQITRYTVPKEVPFTAPSREPAATPIDADPTHRMLGAMVPHGDQFWFFKAVGPIDVMEEERAAFREFVSSIAFEDGKPKWVLPADWREQTGSSASAIRVATIEIGPEDRPVELTVIPLPAVTEDPQPYILANLNRWRGQLRLPDISSNQLADEVETVKLDGATATLVDIAGHMQADASMRAPFASGRAPTTRPQSPADSRPTTSGSATTAPGLAFETPTGWEPGRTGPFRDVAFDVARDGKQAEITVSSLGGQAGGILANVNRWRGQIQLPPMTQADLDAELEEIEVDGHSGQLVELVGETEAIFAAMVPLDDRTWFIKLKGDKELARQERARFEEFARSLRFEAAEGEGND